MLCDCDYWLWTNPFLNQIKWIQKILIENKNASHNNNYKRDDELEHWGLGHSIWNIRMTRKYYTSMKWMQDVDHRMTYIILYSIFSEYYLLLCKFSEFTWMNFIDTRALSKPIHLVSFYWLWINYVHHYTNAQRHEWTNNSNNKKCSFNGIWPQKTFTTFTFIRYYFVRVCVFVKKEQNLRFNLRYNTYTLKKKTLKVNSFRSGM